MGDAKSFSVKDLTFCIPAIASGIAAFFIFKLLWNKEKNADTVNHSIEKDKAKVVHSLDVEDLGDKNAFCRCWCSKKFPYCDGSHNAHNKATGDNVGPLCLNRRVPETSS